jgi:hypothetical protein
MRSTFGLREVSQRDRVGWLISRSFLSVEAAETP